MNFTERVQNLSAEGAYYMMARAQAFEELVVRLSI